MEGGEADPLPARLRRQSNSVSSFSLILLLLRCWPLEAASESATHLFHQSRQTAVHSSSSLIKAWEGCAFQCNNWKPRLNFFLFFDQDCCARSQPRRRAGSEIVSTHHPNQSATPTQHRLQHLP